MLAGIAAAKAAGLAVKINMVALAGLNEDEIPAMLAWCGEQGHDLSLIETMPLGAIDEDRTDRFVPLTRVFDRLSDAFALTRDSHRSGGPARYWRTPWGTQARPDLAAHRQFLRRLQPRAADHRRARSTCAWAMRTAST